LDSKTLGRTENFRKPADGFGVLANANGNVVLLQFFAKRFRDKF
jgi:hypothetical protein